MENLNAVFIHEGMPQDERLRKLNQIAIQQMTVLENVESKHILKGKNTRPSPSGASKPYGKEKGDLFQYGISHMILIYVVKIRVISVVNITIIILHRFTINNPNSRPSTIDFIVLAIFT